MEIFLHDFLWDYLPQRFEDGWRFWAHLEGNPRRPTLRYALGVDDRWGDVNVGNLSKFMDGTVFSDIIHHNNSNVDALITMVDGKSVARNPDVSVDALDDLAWFHPAEVLRNPLLQLLWLTEPEKARDIVARCLLAQSVAMPEVVMEKKAPGSWPRYLGQRLRLVVSAFYRKEVNGVARYALGEVGLDVPDWTDADTAKLTTDKLDTWFLQGHAQASPTVTGWQEVEAKLEGGWQLESVYESPINWVRKSR